MSAIIRTLSERLLRWMHGAGKHLIEYGLVIAVVTFFAAAGCRAFGTRTNTAFTVIAKQVRQYTVPKED